MGNAIKPHIERAEKTGVCQLRKCGLSEFPIELQRLASNLRTLDLSENKITFLPPFIGSFSQMKQLSINSNRLSSIPEQIGSLKKLENLSLENNNLTAIPQSFSQLRALRTLSLAGNKLNCIPIVLSELKQLDVLDLSRNAILQITDDIQGLAAIELNLNQNQIATLSECICQCSRLKVLRLEENCLSISTMTPRILAESSISLLAVDGNLFDMRELHAAEGYDKYVERFTATKKKMF